MFQLSSKLAVKVGIVNEIISTLIKKKQSKTKNNPIFNVFESCLLNSLQKKEKKSSFPNNSETRICMRDYDINSLLDLLQL